MIATGAGSNASVTREHNRRIVMQALRRHELLSRAELARLTGLSAQSMSNIMAELTAEGLLREVGRQRGGRGQPPVAYAIDPGAGLTLGVELRPSGIALVAANLAGDILATREQSGADTTPAQLKETMPRLIGDVMSAAGLPVERLMGLGAVAPRSVGRPRSGRLGTELPGWDDISDPAGFITQSLRDALADSASSEPVLAEAGLTGSCAVVVDTDATAAALAEQLYGAGRRHSRFACLYFGRGLGLGLVLDGRIQRGAHGFAGEIGHVPIRPGGRACACGAQGCLERYISIDAACEDLGDVPAEQLETDPRLDGWIDAAMPHLSAAVAMIENMLDPEIIILCGPSDALVDGLIRRASLLPAPLARHRGERLARGAAGPLCAARGAAALPLYERTAPEFSARLLAQG